MNRIQIQDVDPDDNGVVPAGEYEVAVIYRGQDNVILKTDRPMSKEEIADLAKERWVNGETNDMGNEWEKAEEFVIYPVTNEKE